MLNGFTIYSSLDCTSTYLHTAPSPKAQKMPVSITLIGKFEFEKVPLGMDQAPTHFQQLINEVLTGLPFTF